MILYSMRPIEANAVNLCARKTGNRHIDLGCLCACSKWLELKKAEKNVKKRNITESREQIRRTNQSFDFLDTCDTWYLNAFALNSLSYFTIVHLIPEWKNIKFHPHIAAIEYPTCSKFVWNARKTHIYLKIIIKKKSFSNSTIVSKLG